MLKKYFKHSPFIIFLPFLLVFILLVLKLHSNKMVGDEERYFQFAANLLNGFYSPPSPNIELWNGPGYPIVLLPFVALKLPLITITLLNAAFQYLSIVLLFLTLAKYISITKTIIISLFWACYYISYQDMPRILSETFTLFLATSIIYTLSNAFASDNNKSLYLSGFLIGYLVLTKIIFGYVLISLLAIYIIQYFIQRNKSTKKMVLCLSIAFLITIPYLMYTYSLTHKPFYWGNSGGMSLYWMSTPYENEFGEWNNENFTANCTQSDIPCNAIYFSKNHIDDIKYVNKFLGVEKDNAYKRLAINNIKKHPIKYARNCMANLGRLFFGFPASYFFQRDITLIRIPPNCIIITFILLLSFPTFYKWKNISIEIKFMLLFVFFYLSLSTLVSAYPRQFYVIVPMLLLWIGYMFEKTIAIHFIRNLPENEQYIA